MSGDRDDELTYTTYDGMPCCHCGAKFYVTPIEGTQTMQCPNCLSVLQVTTTIYKTGSPLGGIGSLGEKDWLRCAQCQRHLPPDTEKSVDPVGVLLNQLGIGVLCEECQWMRDEAERRNKR